MEFQLINEFRTIREFSENLGSAVSIFGSARADTATPSYQLAYDGAAMLAAVKYSAQSGGGPGVMRAAKSGARSAGFSAKLFPAEGAVRISEYAPGQSDSPMLDRSYSLVDLPMSLTQEDGRDAF